MTIHENKFSVRCTCGQQLSLPASAIGQSVECPSCQRSLLPIWAEAADNGPQTGPASSEPSPTKACPFCAEKIPAAACKCRFCNEFLDRADSAQVGGPVAKASTSRVDESAAVFNLCISQWDNVWKYLTCGLIVIPAAGSFLLPDLRSYASLILTAVAMAMGVTVLWIFFSTRSRRCIISSGRIETHTGILGKQIEWVSMASVTDIRLKQSLGHRLMGIGTIIISSSDQMTPVLKLYQIPKARQVFEYLQTRISHFAGQHVSRH
ncbi:MAG: PH domain-containing protein [Phycisphaerae bacterium]|nr:PH domain-containing protein [Phycisphaerae bacterium]